MPTTVCPFSAMTAAMGAPSFPNPTMDSFIDSPLARHRHSSARTKCARRYRQTRSCLLASEFDAPDHSQNAANGIAVIFHKPDFRLRTRTARHVRVFHPESHMAEADRRPTGTAVSCGATIADEAIT